MEFSSITMTALAAFLFGSAVGMLLTAIASANRRKQLEEVIGALKAALREEVPQNIPLGAIQAAVADISQQPVSRVASVLEALRLRPGWCRALTLHQTSASACVDQEAARVYLALPIQRAQDVLAMKRGRKG